MNSIDPKSPGKSTQSDDFCDPHGHGVGNPSMGGHLGMSRDDGGSFSGSMSRGGSSPDGDAMVAKYRPRGSAPAPMEAGTELNSDGDDWA